MRMLGIRSLRPRLRMRNGWVILGLWLAGLVVIEIYGRSAATDSSDLLALALVACGVGATWLRHRRHPVPWVTGLGRLFRRAQPRIAGMLPTLGVDLRGAPRYPAGVPPIALRALPVLGLVTLGLLALAPYLPGGMREAISGISYTLWLACLGALWACLVPGMFVLLVFTALVIHDAWLLPVENAAQHRRAKRRLRRTLAAGAAGLLAAGVLLPAWVALAAIAGMIGLWAAALLTPGGACVDLTWRAADGRIRRIGARPAVGIHIIAIGLLMADVAILAMGESIGALFVETTAARTAPVTAVLGRIFVWTTAAACAGATLHVSSIAVRARIATRPLPRPSVFVHDPPAGADAARLAATLANHGYGWRAPPDDPARGDVEVRIVDEPPAPIGLGDPTWPLEVTAEQLVAPITLERIARRFEILHRRNLTRGLRRLFKHAARYTYTGGNGYWLGLQHWFILGLSRDAEDEEVRWEQRPILQQIIGPPYDRVFTRAARAHFDRIMAALEIDMIFVEDRVGFRRFRRVLGVLYEVYDIHGGRRRIEEMDFTGIRECRVMVCEITPEAPFRADGYPEPDYDDIGRARVLHVFRDRGEGDEEAPAPLAPPGRSVPVPLGV